MLREASLPGSGRGHAAAYGPCWLCCCPKEQGRMSGRQGLPVAERKGCSIVFKPKVKTETFRAKSMRVLGLFGLLTLTDFRA